MRVLAVDDLGFRRMQVQLALCQSGLKFGLGGVRQGRSPLWRPLGDGRSGVQFQKAINQLTPSPIQSERRLTILFGSPCLSMEVAFPIKSSMDVIRVPIYLIIFPLQCVMNGNQPIFRRAQERSSIISTCHVHQKDRLHEMPTGPQGLRSPA
jgi:hypothetical protein